MPAVSAAQERLMEAAAHTKGGYGGVPQNVGKEFIGDSTESKPSGKAAGILFFNSKGQALLVKRGDGGDYPRHWAFPAGHIEDGESAEDAALREVLEETGFNYEGELVAIHDDGQFTTFLARGAHDFPVTLCDESTGYVWADVEDMPIPAHPGIASPLRIAKADTELSFAELMRDGVIASPQRYLNVTLFAVRITGTGTSFRASIGEHVYRPPELYLNDEFLARCNGLPVIWHHPEANIMDSEEFGNRIVGTILLPYIQGDEVWGIAKIYDDAAIEAMTNKQMSTSPAVSFVNTSDNVTVTLENGEPLLIEGKPALLDHLAVCEQGVWDKGGAPVGVSLTNEESTMTEATKADATEVAKADSESKIDKLLSCMDSVMKRMDSMEEKFKPAEPQKSAADSEKEEKADADEKEEKEEKAKADKAKADADEKEKADAESPEKEEERAKAKADEEAEYADAQSKADSAYSALGQRAPRPLDGEKILRYKQRLAKGLQTYSADYKSVDLRAIADSTLLEVVSAKIYADAVSAAALPHDVADGVLMEVKRNRDGINMTEFRGKPKAWMGQFAAPKRVYNTFNKGA